MGTSIVLWQDDAVIEFVWILVSDLSTQILKVPDSKGLHWFVSLYDLSPEAGFLQFLCGPVWTNSSACTLSFKVHFYIICTSQTPIKLYCSSQVFANVSTESDLLMHHFHCHSSTLNRL